jgi:hypothetical protein
VKAVGCRRAGVLREPQLQAECMVGKFTAEALQVQGDSGPMVGTARAKVWGGV